MSNEASPVLQYVEQEDAAAWLVEQIVKLKEKAVVLTAGTGEGKTFVLAKFLEQALPTLKLLHDEFSLTPPVMWLTKDAAVLQTEEVLYEMFKFDRNDVIVINYETLRSTEGFTHYTKVEVEEKWGKKFYHYSWRPTAPPVLMIADECHTLMNPDAKITRILAAYRELPGEHYYVGTTATLASKVNELMIPMIGYEIH